MTFERKSKCKLLEQVTKFSDIKNEITDKRSDREGEITLYLSLTFVFW